MAPKKSKSKGKKKGKKENLTEEQKRKLAEQKALAEREKLIARQKLTNAFLKVKKDKEYELIKVNNNKLLDLWRPHLRKQKIKELLEDYQYMRTSFERAFDKKSQMIQELERNMGQTQGDYEKAAEMHLHNLDKLMEFFRKRLEEVKDTFDKTKNKLYAALNEEKKEIEDSHAANMDRIQRGIKKAKDDVIRADREAKMAQYEEMVELRTQGNHELYLYRNKITAKVNVIWDQLHDKLISYTTSTSDKKKELALLSEKDEKMSSTIKDLFDRKELILEGIAKVRNKKKLFEQAYHLYITKIKELRVESRSDYMDLALLKRREMIKCEAALGELAISVHGVDEGLKRVVEQRRKTLCAVERIFLLENEEERADPFLRRWGLCGDDEKWAAETSEEIETKTQLVKGVNKFNIDIHDVVHLFDCDCTVCACEKDEDENNIKPIASLIRSYSKLERFWIKFNKVALEKNGIFAQRHALLKDNEILKRTIRHYMSGMNPPSLDVVKFSSELVEENTKKIQEYIRKIVLFKLRQRCRQYGHGHGYFGNF